MNRTMYLNFCKTKPLHWVISSASWSKNDTYRRNDGAIWDTSRAMGAIVGLSKHGLSAYTLQHESSSTICVLHLTFHNEEDEAFFILKASDGLEISVNF